MKTFVTFLFSQIQVMCLVLLKCTSIDIFQLIYQLTFSSHLGALKQLHGKFCPNKVGSQQYKRGIPSCQDETFYMKLQDIIYEEFTTLPGSWQNRIEFYPGQLGSCNHHLSLPFLPLVMQKVQKVDSVNIQSDYKSTSNKRTDLYCVLIHSGKV